MLGMRWDGVQMPAQMPRAEQPALAACKTLGILEISQQCRTRTSILSSNAQQPVCCYERRGMRPPPMNRRNNILTS